MLDTVTDLTEHGIGNIGRILRDKPDGNALGADQTHDLFHLFHESLRRILEKQMCFVKEERQLGLIKVTCFRQHFVKLRQHPK